MSAHLRPLIEACNSRSCTKRATVELYSTFNEPMGRYCASHGKQALADKLRRDTRPANPEPV